MQSNASFASSARASSLVPTARDLDIVAADQPGDGVALGGVVLDDEDPLGLAVEHLAQRRKALPQLVRRRERRGARDERVVALGLGADGEHRHVARARIVLEAPEELLPVGDDPRGHVLGRQRLSGRRTDRDDALAAQRADLVQREHRRVGIRRRHQHHVVVELDRGTVVGDRDAGRLRRPSRCRCAVRGLRAGGARRRVDQARVVARVGHGDRRGERGGSSRLNVEPLPAADSTRISPPSRWAISREIDSPRPVPP